MNNNYNLPQVPPPVYYPPYDRPPPYNPEYYQTNQTYQTYQIPIYNPQNPYPSQYYNQPAPAQIVYYNDNTNKKDKSCFYVFLGALCCCFLMED
jgi:hypothetical protein